MQHNKFHRFLDAIDQMNPAQIEKHKQTKAQMPFLCDDERCRKGPARGPATNHPMAGGASLPV